MVHQELNIDLFFTPYEAVNTQAGLYSIPRAKRQIMKTLDMVALGDRAHAYARTLSGGMDAAADDRQGEVHQPPVLILDEPTAGVDVELPHQLWETVPELNADGTTIILTTHY